MTATGFIAAGPWDESSLRDIRPDSIDRQIGHYLDRDDMVTTTLSTFSSTTAHCARCHDHKFDPVSQEEYYQLQAVFAGVDKANRTFEPDPEVGRRRRALTSRLKSLDEEIAAASSTLFEASLLAEVAAWEASLEERRVRWRVLEPMELRSSAATPLELLPDHSILASGTRPDKDIYTITAEAPLDRITGLRLEVLPHESLPKNGPGRQDNGNFHLHELHLETIAADGEAKPIALQTPLADFNQQGWVVAYSIDRKKETGWAIFPEVGKAHTATYGLVRPLETAGARLRWTLEQTFGGGHIIGRCRISVTDSPPPFVPRLRGEIEDILATPPEKRDRHATATLVGDYLRRDLEEQLAQLSPPRKVYCGTNRFEPDGTFKPTAVPRPVRVLERGNIDKPGKVVGPGVPALMTGLPLRFVLEDPQEEGARRLALARWLRHPKNVLTWRSIANRLWHHHFGRGIVETPNDFGRMGSTPTHPELLDWLAQELLRRQGSLKEMHLRFVTTAAYRQSSRYDSSSAALDAGNRFLWRMSRRRLDAESVRDALLRISGSLDPTMGGPSVKQFVQSAGVHVTPVVDYVGFSPDDRANYRRSVYRFIFRTLPDPFMEALDCPDASQAAPRRNASITAIQALSMLNDKFVVRQSQHLAERLAAENSDLSSQVQAVFRLLFGRRPDRAELEVVSTYAGRHGLANACRFLVNTNEFMFVD